MHNRENGRIKKNKEIEKMQVHGLGRRSSRSVRTFLSAVTGAFSATVAIESTPASVDMAVNVSGSVFMVERPCFCVYKKEI